MYKIAELVVNMDLLAEGRTANQAQIYKIESDEYTKADIDINIEDEKYERLSKKYKKFDKDNWEYILTGIEFYRQLVNYNGILLHASAVVYKNEAFLFSATSGTGKSTHTSLWLDYFGDEAYILNDDKPAIRKTNGEFFVYGTPWSGKTNLNINKKVPLKAISFIERSSQNWIKRMENKECISKIMEQTSRNLESDEMEKILGFLDDLIRNIPIFKLGCDISEEAVKTSYESMSNLR